MSRCAAKNKVFFFEEPVWDSEDPALKLISRQNGLCLAVPHLPGWLTSLETQAIQRQMLEELVAAHCSDYVLWYYSPLGVRFSESLKPKAIVYDCMDELSAFKGASPDLKKAEAVLFGLADVVFTGGPSLYASKRKSHPNVHLFPSSIDKSHFSQARGPIAEPEDQARIPGPKLGYCGVIDERMDMQLLAAIADSRPAWQILMIGPVVKISERDLPRRKNIHYLGARDYKELPAYMSGWQVGLLPFAINDSTKFISPTKTPEYLAAGLRTVSTAVPDVVTTYGEAGLVAVAATPTAFVEHIEAVLGAGLEQQWLEQVDALLAQNSWDLTWARMRALIMAAIEKREELPQVKSAWAPASVAITAE